MFDRGIIKTATQMKKKKKRGGRTNLQVNLKAKLPEAEPSPFAPAVAIK